MKKRIVAAIAACVLVAGCKLAPDPAKPTTDVAQDPISVAKALVNNNLGPQDLDRVLTQPASFQAGVAYEIGILQGLSPDDARREADEINRSYSPARAGAPTTVTAVTGACTQTVEFKTVVRDPVWCSSYYTFQSSRGTEYVLNFYPGWSVDADNIRWGSTDGQITWSFMIFYGGDLAGANLCSAPKQLQVGNNGVFYAGGINRVRGALYMHHL